MNTILDLAVTLPIPERIKLVEDIWDSIAEKQNAIELTEAQTAEIERRLEYHRRNPDEVVPWEEVRDRLRNKG